jgi:DNA-binding PadR family transcriptional regulator
MSEERLLSLVMSYPHPTALARRVRDGSIFAALRRLEARGLVTRDRGLYRLTGRGRAELAMTRALLRLMVRTQLDESRRSYSACPGFPTSR